MILTLLQNLSQKKYKAKYRLMKNLMIIKILNIGGLINTSKDKNKYIIAESFPK